MNRYIILDENNKIMSIRYGKEIVEREMQSDTGELGQIMQPDGTFITPEPEPIEPIPHQPTNAEIAQMISDLQADLIIAGVI